MIQNAIKCYELDDQPFPGAIATPWLTDHQLLHISKGLVYCYDLNSKEDIALIELSNQVKSTGRPMTHIYPSPNGEWVLWHSRGSTGVVSADGSKSFSWPAGNPHAISHWCANGRDWIQLLRNFKIVPHEITLETATVFKVGNDSEIEFYAKPPAVLGSLEILLVLSPDEIIARTPDPHGEPVRYDNGDSTTTVYSFEILSRADQELTVWSLRHSEPLHRYAISLPYKVTDVAVAPNGKRIAWLTTSFDENATTSTSGRISLWTSNLDGSDLSEVGFIESHPTRGASESMENFNESLFDTIPLDISWSPNGKTIGYVCGNAYWVLTVS